MIANSLLNALYDFSRIPAFYLNERPRNFFMTSLIIEIISFDYVCGPAVEQMLLD